MPPFQRLSRLEILQAAQTFSIPLSLHRPRRIDILCHTDSPVIWQLP